MNDIYSDSKITFFPERLVSLRKQEYLPPAQVLISLSDLCNHDCSWCSYRNSSLPTSKLFTLPTTHNPDRQISTCKALEIMDSCAELGVEAIQLTGGGEPTLHPDFCEIVDRVKVNSLRLGLITNGTKISTGMLIALRNATWIRVSIDAGWPTTYAKIRGISESKWGVVWANIKFLVDLERPVISTSFVVQKDNWREVVTFTKLSKGCKVNHARITALIHQDGEQYFDEFRDGAEDLCEASEAYQDSEFGVINLFSKRASYMNPPEQKKCYYQHLAPFIGADLNVYRCCNTAYTEAGLLGNISNQPFAELWRNPETQRKLLDFDARGCRFCIFQDKNKQIDRLCNPTESDYFV